MTSVVDDLSSALDVETEAALWDRVMAAGEPYELRAIAPSDQRRLEAGIFQFTNPQPRDGDMPPTLSLEGDQEWMSDPGITDSRIYVGQQRHQWWVRNYAGVNPADGRALFYDADGNLTYSVGGSDYFAYGTIVVNHGLIDMLDEEGTLLLTRRESPTEPSNFFVRNLETGEVTALTSFPHPYPELVDGYRQLYAHKYAPKAYRKEVHQVIGLLRAKYGINPREDDDDEEEKPAAQPAEQQMLNWKDGINRA